MKEKYKVEGDNLMVSTDGGKTYTVKGKATQAQKDSYNAHLSKKEEDTERQKYIESQPETTVDQETYDKLMDLYEKAKKKDPTGKIKTKEAEEFQKMYHLKLGKEAARIISTAGRKTKKGIAEGRKWWELESNEDGYFGPRTMQYAEKLKALKPKEKEKEPEKGLPELTVKEKETTPAEAQTVNRYNPQAVLGNKRAPWWLQDIIKVSGAAADSARIKKYQPWQATPGYSLPDATFYDPTRELAANTEAANLAMQAQQAFTNPQQLAAASSLAQGQMAKNAADIMGRYNNLNVTLANQLNQQRTDIMNTASANQAGMNTQLYDKYTTVNQQFDNSKALARQKLRQSYIDAITNKAKTQALNTLYPNFYTDPSSGGYVYADPNYDPNPTVPKDDKEFDEAYKKYGKDVNAYLDWKYGRTGKKKRNSYEDYEGYPGGYGE